MKIIYAILPLLFALQVQAADISQLPGVISLDKLGAGAGASDTVRAFGAAQPRNTKKLEGKTMILGEGSYAIDSTVKLRYSLIGAGQDKTVIRFVAPERRRGGEPTKLALEIGPLGSMQDLTLEIDPTQSEVSGLSLAGGRVERVRVKGEGNQATGLLIRSGANFVDSVEVEGFANAIRAEGAATVVLLRDCNVAGAVIVDGAVVVADGGKVVKADVTNGGAWLSEQGGSISTVDGISESSSPGLPARAFKKPELAPEDWVAITDFKPQTATVKLWNKDRELENWAPALQQAIDSGKRGILIPSHLVLTLLGEVKIRGNVERIAGFGASFFPLRKGGGAAYGCTLTVEGDAEAPVWIDGFDFTMANMTIKHDGGRPVAIADCIEGNYTSTEKAGPLLAEHWTSTGIESRGAQPLLLESVRFVNKATPAISVAGASVSGAAILREGWAPLLVASGGSHSLVGAVVSQRTFRPKDPLVVLTDGAALAGSLFDVSASDEMAATIVSSDGDPAVLRSEAKLRWERKKNGQTVDDQGSEAAWIAAPGVALPSLKISAP